MSHSRLQATGIAGNCSALASRERTLLPTHSPKRIWIGATSSDLWAQQARCHDFHKQNLLSRCFPHSQPSGADDSPPDSVDRPPVQHRSRLQRAGESKGLPRCRNERRLCAIRQYERRLFSTLLGACGSGERSEPYSQRQSISCTARSVRGARGEFLPINREGRARAYHEIVEPTMERFDVLLRATPRTREAHALIGLLLWQQVRVSQYGGG